MVKKHRKKFMAIILTFAMVVGLLPASTITVNAEDTSGTADGTYDFGWLGNISDGGYYALGNKFKVGNEAGTATYTACNGVLGGTNTAFYPSDSTAKSNDGDVLALPYKVIIKAEGGSKCKTFTFKDLGLSAFKVAADYTYNFKSLTVTFKNSSGGTISSDSFSNTGAVSQTSVTQLSTITSHGEWNVSGVSSVEISFVFKYNPPESALSAAANLQFENIAVANVSATTAPSVTTQAVSSIASTTATGNGNITDLGSSNPTQYGVVWNTSTGPTIALDTKTEHGDKTSTGAFTSSITDLTPGTTYYVRAYATNAVNTVYGSEVTFTTVGAPTVTGISPTSGPTAGGTSVTITGTNFIGASDVQFGSANATGYTINSATQITATAPAGSVGTVHVTVTAAGSTSATSSSDQFAYKSPQTITFANPGAQNFGTSPTLTATASSGLTPTFSTSTPGVCSITSGGVLTFLTTGTATIDANQSGNASYLAASTVSRSFTVNAVAPGAPTIGTATAGDTQASVSFTAPVSNGGASITGYTVTSNPGGLTGTGAASPITVTGLTNGTAYTFTVTATNSAGTGSSSAASNSATPKAAQTITFSNPGAQNFGTSPTLTATASSGLTPTFSTSTPGVCSITSGGVLTFLTTGTATIDADQAGNGSYLAASTVSRSFTVNAVAPGTPTIGTATAGDTQASVSFAAPVSNGGAFITGYTVTSNPGGLTGTGAASPITVTGLTNGTAYTFTVTATNSTGTGSSSAASNSATPKASQTITFSNPGAQNFGTSPTLTATSSSGLTPTFTTSTPGVCSVTSGGVLTFLTTGTATIDANQAGNGSYLAASTVSRSFAVNAVLPGAPTIGTATAGNSQASVSFTAPASIGGASITGYTVTSSPGGLTGTGTTSPITVSGLTAGTSYTFTVKATNSAGVGPASASSNAVTPTTATTSSGGGGGGSSTPTPSTTTAPTQVVVNGKTQNAGTTTTTTVGNQSTTTVAVDDSKVEAKLNSEGVGSTVVIPVNTGSAVVVGQLNGQTVKSMEAKEATLEINTGSVSYTLPASEINIDSVSQQIGSQVALKDITISVKISDSSAGTAQIIADTANKNSYQLVVKPVEFSISCTSGGKTVDVSKFNGYVERTIAIPSGVDPSKITTGIVLNSDGTFSHVPTTIVVINGKNYAKINSLTNSTYSVIWNQKTFKDVENHWAKEAVNDMASRLVISGIDADTFAPDREITRAEFASIIVKGLGLMRTGAGKNAYNDVAKSDWYYDAVSIASQYGIVSGFGEGKFGPNEKIIREQAMTMVSRAMKITGLKTDATTADADQLLAAFKDSVELSDYAKESAIDCSKTGIISGKSSSEIAPKANITRGEVAAIVQRLLKKSKLI